MSTTTTAATKRRPKTAAAAATSGNSYALHITVVVGVVVLYVAGSAISFAGLLAIAPWLHLPAFLAPAVPIFIDVAIAVYKVAEVKLKYQNRYDAAKRAARLTLFATTVSAFANGLHVYSLSASSPIVERIGGIAIAALAPYAVFYAALVLTDILIKPKPVTARSTAATKARATKAAPSRARRATTPAPAPAAEAATV